MTRAEAFDALNLPVGSPAVKIKAQYRRLARTAHPDAGGSREDFERIQTAYELLSGPSEAEAHDRAVRVAGLKLALRDVKAKIGVEDAKCLQYSPTDFRRKVRDGWLKKKAEIEEELANL